MHKIINKKRNINFKWYIIMCISKQKDKPLNHLLKIIVMLSLNKEKQGSSKVENAFSLCCCCCAIFPFFTLFQLYLSFLGENW